MTGIDDIEYFRKARAAQEAQAPPADGYRIKELVECSLTSIDDEGDLEMDDIYEIPRTDLAKHHLSDFGAYADILNVLRNGIPKAAPRVGGSREDFIRAMKEAYMPLFHEQASIGVDVALPPVRREVIRAPADPGPEPKLPSGPYQRFTMDCRSDGCGSTIPGARADWVPSKVVTYEPDLGEDLEISTEEERAWRAKR